VNTVNTVNNTVTKQYDTIRYDRRD